MAAPALPDAGPPSRQLPRRWGLPLLACALVVAAAAWALYSARIAPLRQPVLSVDGQPVAMGYLITRLAAGDTEPLAMLDTLTREQIMVAEAARAPFGIVPADGDVEAWLRRSAAAGGPPLSDAHYAAWRRDALNESRMTETDFLRTARMALVRERMTDGFARGLPAAAPQVHLHMLAAKTLDDAVRLRERLEQGEDFAALAAQASDDPVLRDRQGDLGWMPRAALSPSIAQAAFDQLPVGAISAPLGRVDSPGFVLIMVSERSPSRPVGAPVARQIGQRRLDDWLDRAYARHAIVLSGLDGAYNSQTDRWIRQQVARRQPAGTR